jgi:DNA replication and repair protein RecF
VAASVERTGAPAAVDVGTGLEAGSERRAVRIDHQAVRGLAALSEVTSVLWLTPVMDRLFVEGASGRRRFLDRLALGLDPAHAPRAAAYERALRERARLLKEGRFDASWLEALEETMAHQGVAMAVARRRAAAELNQACSQGIGPFPAAHLAVAGSVEDSLDGLAPQAAEVRLRDALAASRRREAESGHSAEGPHRSNLLVRHVDRNLPADQCSTGEQKAVLVAIVLGQARLQARLRGAPPILLLDEITAHLDQARRVALFEELLALGAQSWMSGTDRALFAELADRAVFFGVRDAQASRG